MSTTDKTPEYILNIIQRNRALWKLSSKDPQAFKLQLSEWETSIRERLTVLRGSTSRKPLISIVIPARNEEAYILATLEAIAAQKNVEGVEVILIANNCSKSDMTIAIAENCGVKVFDYHYTSDKEKPIGLARHIGLIFAQGKLYVSTDADTLPMQYWLVKLTKPLLDDKKIGFTTSHSRLYEWEKDKKVQKVDFQRSFIRERFAWTGLVALGHNMVFRKKDGEEIGGFNRKFYPGEDTDMGFRLTVPRSMSPLLVKDNNATVWISPRRVKKYGGEQFLANYFTIYRDADGKQRDARESFKK